jgi:hypothetical protein
MRPDQRSASKRAQLVVAVRVEFGIAGLLEGNADPIPSPPHDMTGQMQIVFCYDERKSIGNANLAFNLYRGSGCR